MAELAVTVERVAVIYDDQLFQMKNTKVATEAKTWHIIRQCGRGETGVYPGVSCLSSKSYDSGITLAVAPGHWICMLVTLHSSCKWNYFVCGLFRKTLICSKELKGLLPVFEVIYLHCCYHAVTSVLKSLKCLTVAKTEKNVLVQVLDFV